jgi:hypothetical protein
MSANPDSVNEARGTSPVSTSRRRLLQGATAAAPVVMTFMSRSVTAGTCAPASTFASLNASHPTLVTYTCGGCLPAYWSQDAIWPTWPAPLVASGDTPTMFDAQFGTTGGYPGKTLLDVLKMPEGLGKDGLAPYAAAALLNAAAGKTLGVIDAYLIKQIWLDVVSRKGYFTPSAGIKWYPDYSKPDGTGGIKVWLKTTMA